MATLVNKMNREVKVIIPNMREFRVFFSDNEGSVMFFKRDWEEEKQDSHWKPSEEQQEMDLDAEIEKELRLHYNDDQDVYWWNYLKNSFRHFYELGKNSK